MQGRGLVCGYPGAGLGAVQHLPGLPVLAHPASGGWHGLLHSLLGHRYRQCHVLCPTGEHAILLQFARVILYQAFP